MTTPFPGEPNQVPFRGEAAQVWSGTGTGGTPILLYNQDSANVVTANYRPNVQVGDSNAVPIPPMSSVSMDGGRTIYANAPAGTQPLLVIPGGGSFFQPVTSLTVPTGATSGARITLNGLLGLIEDFDSANALIGSIAPASGSDGEGNQVLQGISCYGTAFTVALIGGAVVFYTGSNTAGWTFAAEIQIDSSGDLFLSTATTTVEISNAGNTVTISGNLTVDGSFSASGDTGTAGLPNGGISGTSGAQSAGTAHTHSPGSYSVTNGMHAHTL
jgi:hypothetical protein